MGRALAIAGLSIGALALVLQFMLTVPAAMSTGRSLAGSVVFYFSFFTILTNVAAVLVYATALMRPPALSIFRSARTRASIAVAIAVVAIVYAAVLARLWQPEGLFLLADRLLHYVAPPLFILWWIIAGRTGELRLADLPLFLVYPLAYLTYVLARAPFAGEVPYPFLDYSATGWGSVALACLGVLVLFVILSLAAVGLDRLAANRNAKTRPLFP